MVLHGVGVSCVNALSTKLLVTVKEKAKFLNREYATGIPQHPVREKRENLLKQAPRVQFSDGSIFTTTVYNKDILEGRLRGTGLSSQQEDHDHTGRIKGTG